MDNTLHAIRNLIKSALIEAAEERPDLFGPKTIHQEKESQVLLSSSEAAKFFRVSVKRIYQLTDAGVIKSYRSGRKLLYNREELINSLKKYSVE